MAREDSQQLRAQDLAPVRRCGTKGIAGQQGREGGGGGRNRDGSREVNEDEDRDGYEGRDGGGNGSGNGDEN